MNPEKQTSVTVFPFCLELRILEESVFLHRKARFRLI
jgi:hypothetical protein